MKCEKCGNYISGDGFCEKCGTKIDSKHIVFTKNNNREFYNFKIIGLGLLLLSTFFPYVSITNLGNFSLLSLWQNIGYISTSFGLDGIESLNFIFPVSILYAVALVINIFLILYSINGAAKKVHSDTTPIACIWSIALAVTLFIMVLIINNMIRQQLGTDLDWSFNVVSLTSVPYIQFLLSFFISFMDLKLE